MHKRAVKHQSSQHDIPIKDQNQTPISELDTDTTLITSKSKYNDLGIIEVSQAGSSRAYWNEKYENERTWLLYSPSVGSVYCFVCKLFRSKRFSRFVTRQGFGEGRNLSS